VDEILGVNVFNAAYLCTDDTQTDYIIGLDDCFTLISQQTTLCDKSLAANLGRVLPTSIKLER